MRSNNTPKISITLTQRQLGKIQLMQKSISEPTTYAKILDGLIDVGFSSALHILHDEGTLDEETYRKYVMLLPDFMRE
jgi:hypothetical protein